MSDETLSPVKRALVALEEMRAQLDAAERRRTESIAIIGMACRFPGGADTPEALWRLLEQGVDAVTEVPPERWILPPAGEVATPGERAARWGAFVGGVDLFEPQFFGISPREAAGMDPQQRLLLELSWEALERAGQVPGRLAGTRTGVFLGLMNDDYKQLSGALHPSAHDLYTSTGNGHCFAAGRLSHVLGLEGPSLTVDTACSSSLVAAHLACQSLRAGESALALVGGVNLMLSPLTTHLVSRLDALSPEGRCKTFDAQANGYVRGEGAGLVVLKRLSDALRDGDPILASIRGSAVNQDGRGAGLTAPNVLSQQAMLRRALEAAGVSPDEIGYVETHGTGTALGDPIEVEALAAVLGRPRTDGSTCALGALKTNIGHLEAAAGVASLIKAVLALQHGAIPQNLHFETQNPRISLEGTSLVIPAARRPWPGGPRPRFAGVSSFGLSGTNAHVVLEEAPRPPFAAPDHGGQGPVLLPLSARGPESLAALARATLDVLAAPSAARLDDVAFTAGALRTHHDQRLAVVGRSREELAAALGAFLRGELGRGASRGERAPGRRPRLVFVFPGHGSQRAGMGRELIEEEPAFRAVIEACDREIRAQAGWSLLDELRAGDDRSRLGEVGVVQPALFAVEIALAALFRSWGIEPDAVVGHSMGEVAAACFTGALELRDAVRIMCARARLLGPVSGKGRMAMVELSPDEAREALRGHEDRVFPAIHNGPRSTVLSGDPAALDAVIARLERAGVLCRRVNSDVAFHSPHMAPLRGPLAGALAGLTPAKATLSMVSTVTGEPIEGEALGPDYWVKNLAEPVLFARAVGRLIEGGHDVFLEMSPHPILLPSIDEALRHAGRAGATLPSTRRDQEERRTLLESLGALYTRGFAVDFRRVHAEGARCAALPTYPWHRKRYWIDDADGTPRAPVARAGEAGPGRADVLHAIQWDPEAAPPASSPAPRGPGRWLLLADAGGVAEALATRLEMRGEVCQLVFAPELVAGALAASDPPCRGVVHLSGLDLGGAVADGAHACASLLHLTQAMVRWVAAARAEGSPAPPRLWLVTSGAQAVGSDAAVTSPAQAPLWGLGRVIASEHAELRFASVDLGSGSRDEEAASLFQALWYDDPAEQVGFRGGARHVPRIAPLALPARRGGPRERLRADGTYLITGGLGEVGIAVARSLTERGAGHLVLMGRSGPGAAATAAIDAMRRAGACVSVERGDVALAGDVARVLAAIDRPPTPLRGVVHAAGVLDDRLLVDLDVAGLRKVTAPKVLGAANLHHLTQDRPLDLFVLFSSMASWLGLPGQGSYAAGNAFLDALAHHRRARGLPALCIDWAGWSGLGFAGTPGSERALAHLARRGVESLSPAQALDLLGLLIARGSEVPARILTLPVDLTALEAEYRFTRSSRWLSLLGREGLAGAERPGEAASALRSFREALLATRPASRQLGLLEEHVRAEIGHVLRLAPAELGRDTPMRDLGMDSFMAVELRRRLELSLGLALSAALVWQRPTIAELTLHLSGALASGDPTPPPPQGGARNGGDRRAERSRGSLARAPAAPEAELAGLLAEIEQLSEDEVRLLLSEGEGAAANHGGVRSP